MKKQILTCLIFNFAFLIFNFSASAQSIAGGLYYSLYLCSNNTPMACGSNGDGQLGDGTNTDQSTPVQVSSLSGITAIVVGYRHSLFLKNDGTVWACGSNFNGELGDGTNTDRITPIQVSSLSGITAIAAGQFHSLFLKNDGTVWACGYNINGQLGDGTSTDQSTPVQVSSLSGIIAIVAGGNSSFFLKNDGTAWACGSNTFGQLADGTTTDRDTPVQVSSLSRIIAIAAGTNAYSIFLKNDGNVWTCGYNNDGQLGDGTTIDRTTPVQVSSLSGITAIAAGGYHSLFLKNNGTVWACGYNYFGQLGDGDTTDRNTPVQVSSLSGITTIAGGYFHSLFVKNDGTAWACGSNIYGELGDGTTTDRNTPIQTTGLCYVTLPNKTATHYAHGYLYDDANNDSSKQTGEAGLSFAIVATPGNHYTFSDTAGWYSLGLNDSVNYTITPMIPQRFAHMVKDPSPANYTLLLDTLSPVDTTGFDFGFDVNLCHQLRVDVASNRRRRCFLNTTSVYYINEGLATATGVKVRVKMPEYVIPIRTSLTYTYDADSNMVFALGTLNAGHSGYIYITDSVACINGITGLTQCTQAWITPPNQCLIDFTTGTGWDKSSMKVEGECVNDTVRFVIYNTGAFSNGDMDSSSKYRIYADNGLMQTNTFKLTGGDSLIITIVSGGATIRLEADQRPGHPGNSQPRKTMEACGTSDTGTFTVGMVNQAPQDDKDVDIEIDCMPIIDSYDPNEKEVSPEGVGATHNVLPNTLLDYTLHFQNTGTDTAYKVVVIDTLSQYLDLSTFEAGTSSYPYTLDISGEGVPVLKFTFNYINLPDTFTNEPKSHGFVKFKIAPKSATPIGTVINNSVDIYFDYNLPIRTNNAWITLACVISFSQSPTICNGQSVTVGSNTYTTSGAYTDTLTSANGCDSIVTTNLIVKPNSTFSQNLTINNGDSIQVGTYIHKIAGTFIDTIMASNGCDSIVTTKLTVLIGIQSKINTKQSTITIFPNPTMGQLIINTGNFASMNNYTLKITNVLSQTVFSSLINQQVFTLNMNTFGGKGIYFLEIYDSGNTKVEVSKIILQ